MVKTIWARVGESGVIPKNIEDVSGYGDKISLKLMKNLIIQFTMKRDLYRFAKARRDKRVELFKLSADEIKMIEHNYYSKFNTNYYG